MSEVFVKADLESVDAVAVRTGDEILFRISPRLSQRARLAAVDHLRKEVRDTAGTVAAASLPLGKAASLVDDLPGSTMVPFPRSAQLGAVGAGLMLDALTPSPPSGLFEDWVIQPVSTWLAGFEDYYLGMELI